MKQYDYSKDIKIPIFIGTLRIVLTNHELEIDEGITITSDNHGNEIRTADLKGNLLFIVAFRIDKHFHHGIIAHECLHFVIDLFQFIKLQLSEEESNGNEAYTYMLGWAVNQVYDFMKENNIKIK